MHIIHKYFVPLTNVEGRLHLRKTQINLVFRSICTTFSLFEKVLSLEKAQNSFGFLLTYSYLSPLVNVGCISEKLK